MIFWYHVGLVGQIKSLHLEKWQVLRPFVLPRPSMMLTPIIEESRRWGGCLGQRDVGWEPGYVWNSMNFMDFLSWKLILKETEVENSLFKVPFLGGWGDCLLDNLFWRLEAMRIFWMLFLEHLHGFCWKKQTGKLPSLKLNQQVRPRI